MHGVVSFNMGNNLFAQREKSILVGFLVFMDMDRGYFKSVITFGFDLFVGSALVILPDVYHQHMQMKQLFLLHTIAFSLKNYFSIATDIPYW